VQARDVASVALAGGSTPRGLYRLLATDARYRDAVAWARVELFWGDERHVPPDHPDSNYGMAAAELLAHVPIHPARVHRIQGEHPDVHAAAAAYEQDIRRTIPTDGVVPQLDLVLLGLGADGHTASLFPGTAAVRERDRLVVAHYVEAVQAERITMTLPLLNAARHVLFVVTGSDKADAVRRVLDTGEPLPAAAVRPTQGELTWLVDRAAARDLSPRP
jgi:6-phosphogluconolactonase